MYSSVSYGACNVTLLCFDVVTQQHNSINPFFLPRLSFTWYGAINNSVYIFVMKTKHFIIGSSVELTTLIMASYFILRNMRSILL